MDKQLTGFKFGKYRLQVISELGTIEHKSRKYKLVKVRTNDGLVYYSLRLYNAQGKFIKQFLFEPEIKEKLKTLIERG